MRKLLLERIFLPLISLLFVGLSMTAFAASLQAEEGEEATGTTKLKVVVKNAENGRFSYLMDMDEKKFQDGATLTTGEMYDVVVVPNDGYKPVVTMNKTDVPMSKEGGMSSWSGGIVAPSTAETLIEVDFVKDDTPSTKMFAVNVRYEGDGTGVVELKNKADNSSIEAGSTVPEGTIVIFTPKPAEGSHFSRAFIGLHGLVEPVNGFEFVVDKRIDLAVVFLKGDTPTIKPKHAVNVAPCQYGKVVLMDEDRIYEIHSGTELEEGENVKVVPTALEGYKLSTLTAGGEAVNMADSLFTVKDKAVEVVATFVRDTNVPGFAVTLAKMTNGSVSLFNAIGIDIPSGTELPKGTEVFVVGEPVSGYALESLKAGEEDILETKKFVVKDKPVQVIATFKETGTPSEEVTITYTTPGNGKISVLLEDKTTIVPSGSSVKKGTKLLVRTEANSGYELDKVVDNNGQAVFMVNFGVYSSGFYTVKGNSTLTATFKKKGATTDEVTVTYNATPENGKIEVKDGDKAVASGSKVKKGATLTIIAT
ncbi:MAG: hypothetical protein SPI72_03960, partial [Porphyromonas sp.]|nr:hypothetical protein [Porphyromonas sp.]